MRLYSWISVSRTKAGNFVRVSCSKFNCFQHFSRSVHTLVVLASSAVTPKFGWRSAACMVVFAAVIPSVSARSPATFSLSIGASAGGVAEAWLADRSVVNRWTALHAFNGDKKEIDVIVTTFRQQSIKRVDVDPSKPISC